MAPLKTSDEICTAGLITKLHYQNILITKQFSFTDKGRLSFVDKTLNMLFRYLMYDFPQLFKIHFQRKHWNSININVMYMHENWLFHTHVIRQKAKVLRILSIRPAQYRFINFRFHDRHVQQALTELDKHEKYDIY